MKRVNVITDSVTNLLNKGVGSNEFNGLEVFSTMHPDSQSYYCLSAQPLTDDRDASMAERLSSPLFYPLEQQNWEDQIIWDDPPDPSSSPQNNETGFVVSDPLKFQIFSNEKDPDNPIMVEAFGSRDSMELSDYASYGRKYHPQLLRLESMGADLSDLRRSEAIHSFSKLIVKNRELTDGSWLDGILWEPRSCIPKPKLIFDLQDEEMLFEILDNKEGKHLKEHAGAMIVSRSLKSIGGNSVDPAGRSSLSVAGFNIANDKFYSNRKTSQQLKTHSKKRSTSGLKVLHSTPALKLQTMKLRLSKYVLLLQNCYGFFWLISYNHIQWISVYTWACCVPLLLG